MGKAVRTLDVALGNRAYPIHIGHGLLTQTDLILRAEEGFQGQPHDGRHRAKDVHPGTPPSTPPGPSQSPSPEKKERSCLGKDQI